MILQLQQGRIWQIKPMFYATHGANKRRMGHAPPFWVGRSRRRRSEEEISDGKNACFCTGKGRALSPGLIATPMGRREAANLPQRAELAARIPPGRQGTMAEIADVVAFLVPPGAGLHDRHRPAGGRRREGRHDGLIPKSNELDSLD